jgi:hypothetical protein
LRKSNDHWDGEGQGLSRAGFSAAENIATRKGVWKGVDLDREGELFAIRREDGDESCGHAERAECGGSHSGTCFMMVTDDAQTRGSDRVGEHAGWHSHSPKKRCQPKWPVRDA